MQRRGRFLPIYEINQHDKSKDQRIRGLQPVYMNKKVFHPKDHPVVPYLEEELLRFPRSRFDDLADMLSMTLDYLTPPRPKTSRYKHHYLY
jgi:phage terminase large subunit-like protein